MKDSPLERLVPAARLVVFFFQLGAKNYSNFFTNLDFFSLKFWQPWRWFLKFFLGEKASRNQEYHFKNSFFPKMPTLKWTLRISSHFNVSTFTPIQKNWPHNLPIWNIHLGLPTFIPCTLFQYASWVFHPQICGVPPIWSSWGFLVFNFHLCWKKYHGRIMISFYPPWN